MKNALKLRATIVKIEKALIAMKSQKEKLLKELQKKCGHEIIVEKPYSTVFGINPPRRICVICSLEEEGWGCGYDKLQKKPSKIVERDEFYRFRDLSFSELKKGLMTSEGQ